MSAGKLIKDTHINELSTAINEEATRRGINLTRVRPNVPNGGDVDNLHMRQLRDAIDEILPITQLHSLLTSYPTVRAIVKTKPNLPAKNLVALFKPLDNLLANWGIETIGKPWEKAPYNPQLHQSDSQDIEEGELVYIRFIGYRQGDRILSPAKVSRTLPGKDKK